MAKFNSNTGSKAGKKSSRSNIPNRVSNAFISELITNQADKIESALLELYKTNPQGYLQAIIRLLPYCLPSIAPMEFEDIREPIIKSTDITLSNGNQITINTAQ